MLSCISGFELTGFGIWSGILEFYSIKESSRFTEKSFSTGEPSTTEKSYASEEVCNTENNEEEAEEAKTTPQLSLEQ